MAVVVVVVVMVVVVTPAGEQGPLGDGVRGDGAENNQRWQHHREECLEYNISTIYDYNVTKQPTPACNTTSEPSLIIVLQNNQDHRLEYSISVTTVK